MSSEGCTSILRAGCLAVWEGSARLCCCVDLLRIGSCWIRSLSAKSTSMPSHNLKEALPCPIPSPPCFTRAHNEHRGRQTRERLSYHRFRCNAAHSASREQSSSTRNCSKSLPYLEPLKTYCRVTWPSTRGLLDSYSLIAPATIKCCLMDAISRLVVARCFATCGMMAHLVLECGTLR